MLHLPFVLLWPGGLRTRRATVERPQAGRPYIGLQTRCRTETWPGRSVRRRTRSVATQWSALRRRGNIDLRRVLEDAFGHEPVDLGCGQTEQVPGDLARVLADPRCLCDDRLRDVGPEEGRPLHHHRPDPL